MTLDEIFIKHGTDKSSLNHNYGPHYELMFAPYKDRPINLLELGVWEGASCKAWKEFFPQGNIFGADLDYKPQYNEDRIFMIQADQRSWQDLNRLNQMRYDIIIDDASHVGEDQLKSFSVLFPVMPSGSIYVIEDILCAYDSRWSQPINIMDFVSKLPGMVQMDGAVPGSQLCANKYKAKEQYDGDYFQKNILSIYVGMGIVFIKKI